MTDLRHVPGGTDLGSILGAEIGRLRREVDDLRSTALARVGVATATCRGAKVVDGVGDVVPTSTYTAITFSAESIDTDGFFDLGTPTQLTIPADLDGRYLIVGSVAFAANASGQREVQVAVNAASLALQRTNAAAAGTTILEAVGFATLTAGAFVELYAWQNSGGDLATSANSATVHLDLIRLGDA